jgi:hypothetical protein
VKLSDGTVPCCTLQYSIMQYSTVQYKTVQCTAFRNNLRTYTCDSECWYLPASTADRTTLRGSEALGAPWKGALGMPAGGVLV